MRWSIANGWQKHADACLHRPPQVLLEKGVLESKMLFLTLIAAPEGIKAICCRFPKITVVTSEIDEGIGPGYHVVPGQPLLQSCGMARRACQLSA